jgi:hypothetical protein
VCSRIRRGDFLAGSAGTLALASLPRTAFAGETPIVRAPLAIVGAKIYPEPGMPAIHNGTVLIENGKIVAVGGRDDVPLKKVEAFAGVRHTIRGGQIIYSAA